MSRNEIILPSDRTKHVPTFQREKTKPTKTAQYAKFNTDIELTLILYPK